MTAFVHRLRRRIDRYAVGFLAYVAIGGASAVVEWTSFYFSLPYLGSVGAAVAGFAFGTVANFVLSRGLVFWSKRSVATDLMLVFVVSLVAFAVNLAVFLLLYRAADVDVLISKVLGTGSAFTFNYLARQFYVFSARSRFPSLSSRFRSYR